MSKKNKPQKSHLTADEKKLGKNHVYLLIGMIIAGLIMAAYHMHIFS
jgi:hypothetical protein